MHNLRPNSNIRQKPQPLLAESEIARRDTNSLGEVSLSMAVFEGAVETEGMPAPALSSTEDRSRLKTTWHVQQMLHRCIGEVSIGCMTGVTKIKYCDREQMVISLQFDLNEAVASGERWARRDVWVGGDRKFTKGVLIEPDTYWMGEIIEGWQLSPEEVGNSVQPPTHLRHAPHSPKQSSSADKEPYAGPSFRACSIFQRRHRWLLTVLTL